MEVRDIIKPAIAISDSATFRDAIEVMIRQQTNSLLVVSEEGVLVGEIHMSDILDAIVPDYLDGDSIGTHFTSDEAFGAAIKDVEEKPVESFMSTDINPITLEDDLLAIATVAIAGRRAHIPVVDKDERPIGVISRRGIKHLVANALGIRDSF